MPVSTQTVPYFPPPPRSAALAKSKSKSRTNTSSSTLSENKSTKTSKPTSLHRSRQYILPCLLILTFAIFILGLIYGYCVAKPHTQLTPAQLASNTTVELDGSIFSRDDVYLPTASSTNATLSPTSTKSRYPRTNNLSLSLAFYLLSSPIVLLSVISLELILTYSFPTILSARKFHYGLLATHTLSVADLIISSSFWTACELPSPNTTSLEKICPAQVRGHFMYGIHELSIAKAVIAWVLVVGLIWHVICLFRGIEENRRRWAIGRNGHGSAEIVLKVEDGGEQGVKWDEKVEPRREARRERVVRFLR